MRSKFGFLKIAMPVVATFALAACGGSDEDGAAENGTGEVLGVSEADSALSDITIEPGEYRSEFEMVEFAIPGLDAQQTEMMRNAAQQGATQSSTYCITPEKAAEGPERMLQEIAESDCVFSSLDSTGGIINAEMQCISADGLEGTFKMQGEVKESSWSMEMQIDQRVPGVSGDGRIQMTMRSNSTRIGECAS